MMKKIERIAINGKWENVASVGEVHPVGSQKSFYGKALVINTASGAYLMSYNTIVCGVDNNGKFHKYWNGYSATTMRHINAFNAVYGNGESGKKWWVSIA